MTGKKNDDCDEIYTSAIIYIINFINVFKNENTLTCNRLVIIWFLLLIPIPTLYFYIYQKSPCLLFHVWIHYHIVVYLLKGNISWKLKRVFFKRMFFHIFRL